MAVFSTSQVRHLYVAKKYVESGLTDTSVTGDITRKEFNDGPDSSKKIYFQVMGADTALKSDVIPCSSITYAKVKAAADMVTPLKAVTVSLVDGTTPIIGQDYILRIAFRQFYGMSDEDQYFKEGAVHVTKATSTAAEFYKAMVDSLNRSFAREVGATLKENPYLRFEATSTGINIYEKPQEWKRGIESQERVLFDAYPTTVYDGIDDVIWGIATDTTPKKGSNGTWTPTLNLTGANQNAIGNGQQIADLEWFCMGERGDQYRYMGYPNYIPTEYLVDPTKQYNVLEIHYAFTDTGINSYRSEKDITIVSEDPKVINNLAKGIVPDDKLLKTT